MLPGAGQGVVLLHGHGRRGRSLSRLARAAREQGYATLVPRYRYRCDVPAILAELAPQVAAFAREIPRPLHFVTHSLGGLVARALLASPDAMPAGRMVMLGPPNAGSEWADLLFRLRLDRVVLGAIGGHLRTRRTAADEALLGAATTGVGVIAGNRALDPVFPRLFLPLPNDGKVSVTATRLAGAEHLVLPVTHTLMVYDREATRQALWFLEHGRFDRAGRYRIGALDDDIGK